VEAKPGARGLDRPGIDATAAHIEQLDERGRSTREREGERAGARRITAPEAAIWDRVTVPNGRRDMRMRVRHGG
jgi:hypothetical protein